MANTRRSARISAASGYDENKISEGTRVTRAKAAALESKTGLAGNNNVLVSKQANGQVNTRKRSALGDVSNFHKDAEPGEKGGKPAAKIVKTTSSTTISSRSRTVKNTEEKEREEVTNEETGLQSKRWSSTTSNGKVGASTRRKRAPLRSVNNSTVPVRAKSSSSVKNASAHPSSTLVLSDSSSTSLTRQSIIEDIVEEESDSNKENEDPMQLENSSKEMTSLSSVEDPVLQEDVQTRDWDDLDAEEMDDPTMVAEYVNEIFDYMKELEVRTMPNARYMDSQRDLSWKMRDILIDWLVEVHLKFRLLPETLFLAVNIVDRFLSERLVTLDKLQLVGITGMFIAAKYEEVFSPSIQNFVYVADSGYSEEEILKAETFILEVLDFNLSYPNPMNFLRRNSKADNYDIQTRTVAKYLMEIALLDHRFMKYYPSHVAATAMYLARVILERSPWDKNLIHYSGGYTEEKIQPVCNLMIDYLVKPVTHEAFFKKYASKRFMKASIIARQWAKSRVRGAPAPNDLDDSEQNEADE
ncbi:cyclin-like protein [Dipodascopsis uninucleata]